MSPPCARPHVTSSVPGKVPGNPHGGRKATMASWGDLVHFVRSEYQVVKAAGDEVRIVVGFEDQRRQTVILQREVMDKREEWVQIVSPCGRIDQVDIQQVLEELGNTTVVGGAVIIGDHLVLRHSLPLENLDINEFVDPLALVAGTADRIEERFVGGDGY
jgi:hypothetical protein